MARILEVSKAVSEIGEVVGEKIKYSELTAAAEKKEAAEAAKAAEVAKQEEEENKCLPQSRCLPRRKQRQESL